MHCHSRARPLLTDANLVRNWTKAPIQVDELGKVPSLGRRRLTGARLGFRKVAAPSAWTRRIVLHSNGATAPRSDPPGFPGIGPFNSRNSPMSLMR